MRKEDSTFNIPLGTVTFDEENNATFTPSGEFSPIVIIELYADEGKVLKSKITGEVLTNHITLGTETDETNYEEVDAI